MHLLGRVTAMSQPLYIRRRARIGHEEGARESLQLHVQIKDEADIDVLIIQPAFRAVMKWWMVLEALVNTWCEFLVQA